jgi:hypothetical protein
MVGLGLVRLLSAFHTLGKRSQLQARETLREEVANGFVSLDSSQGVPAEEVYSRAERRIAEVERGAQ